MTTSWFAICKLLEDYDKSTTSFLSILPSLIIMSQEFFVNLITSQYLSTFRRTKQDTSCGGKCGKSASLVTMCCLEDTGSLH